MKGKKAVEWPVHMIYVMLVAFLLIMGLFMIFKLVQIGDVNVGGKIGDLKFTLLADRLINSPDCLAWEEQFIDMDGNLKYQVRPGIIDWSKASDAEQIKNCIKDRSFSITVENLDKGFKTGAETIPAGERISDYYFVKIYDNGELYDGKIRIGLFTL